MTVTKPSLLHRPDVDACSGNSSGRLLTVKVAGKRNLKSFNHTHLARAASYFLVNLNTETIFGK